MSLLSRYPHPSCKNSYQNTFKSVIAAFFGVQSDRSRKRDFSQGNVCQFIVVAFICLLLFITALIIIVSIVIGK